VALKLIVGLGNPGDAYKDTRHNMGFLIADAFIKRSESPVSKQPTLKSHVYRVTVNDHRLIVAKPQTFMNRSGEAVRAIMDYYRLTPAEIAIVFDDFDVPFGYMRCRFQGSAGTHNGMKSVIAHVGTTSFLRLRVGIGPKPPHIPTDAYVLNAFASNERSHIPDMVARMVDAMCITMTQPPAIVMNRLNGVSFLPDVGSGGTF
jgi:PTH1 family peptidyl-tRNA hydrolase